MPTQLEDREVEGFKQLLPHFTWGSQVKIEDDQLKALYEALINRSESAVVQLTGLSKARATAFLRDFTKQSALRFIDEDGKLQWSYDSRLPIKYMWFLMVAMKFDGRNSATYGRIKNYLLQNWDGSNEFFNHMLLKSPYNLVAIPEVGMSKIDTAVEHALPYFPKAEKLSDGKRPLIQLKLDRLRAYLRYQIIAKMDNTDNVLRKDVYHQLFADEDGFTGIWEFNAEDKDDVDKVIDEMFVVKERNFRHDEEDILVPRWFEALESEVANKLKRLVSGVKFAYNDYVPAGSSQQFNVQINQKIKDVELSFARDQADGLWSFDDDQVGAIKGLVSEPVSLLQGYAGTGKSTLMKVVYDIFAKSFNSDQIALVAPTGKAAKNLGMIIGADAMTIHALIGKGPSGHPKYNRNNHIHKKVVIVDEVSMAGLSLFHDLVMALDDDTRLILVGDQGQLDPVKDLPVMRVLLKTGLIRSFILEKVHRQASGSEILDLATALRSNRLNEQHLLEVMKYDRKWHHEGQVNYFGLDLQQNNKQIQKDTQLALNYAFAWLKSQGQLADKNSWMIIAPQNSEVESLNKWAQRKFNTTDRTSGLRLNGFKLLVGDRVLNMKNNHSQNFMNGNSGEVIDIMPAEVNDGVDIVRVKDGSNEIYDLVTVQTWSLQQDLHLGYAETIHKSQGDTIKNVVLVLSNPSDVYMINRELLYTAVTRAKLNLFIIADPGLIIDGAKKSATGYLDLNFLDVLDQTKLEFDNEQDDDRVNVKEDDLPL